MSAIPDKNNDGNAVWAVVLMYGGEDITRACIESLVAQDRALTVLLVDNASPDGAGERLRLSYPQIEYLQTASNLGYTGGNNRGANYAIERNAEWILIVNNDTVLERDCVSRLLEAGRSAKRVGAVSPKILYYDDPRRIWYAGGDHSAFRALGRHRRFRELDRPEEKAAVQEDTFATGCCVLVPAAVFGATGGFREDFFMYCEDVEFSLRLRHMGYRLYYEPRARVLHREPIEKHTPTPSAVMHRDRNRRRLVRQHYAPIGRALFALWFYPTRALRFAQYLIAGNWLGARALLSGAFTP